MFDALIAFSLRNRLLVLLAARAPLVVVLDRLGRRLRRSRFRLQRYGRGVGFGFDHDGSVGVKAPAEGRRDGGIPPRNASRLKPGRRSCP